MLLVTSKSNNIYTILDTDDMTSDIISKEELLPSCRQVILCMVRQICP